jgi:hypothetical protein
MSDNPAPDQGPVLAEDGQLHTAECVSHGWWLLDWEATCVTHGVPDGGSASASIERSLFVAAIQGGA